MTNVLYDAPGPVARRRALIGSVVALILVALVLVWAFMKLEDQGQFEADKWAPLFDPNDPAFDQVWKLLWEGLLRTLKAAVFAMAASLVIGTLFAVLRISSALWYRWAVIGVLEVLRGIPVVIAIYFSARVLPELGVELQPLWYLVIGLTTYNSVMIAEIVRAGILSLPRGQSEAAYAVGLTRGQTLRIVQLPQAFRVMLPALISQLVVVLKDTSLGFIILYPELVRTGGIIVQNLRNPIQTYFVIGVMFIIVNYTLSRIAVWIERRLSKSTVHTHATAEVAEAAPEQG
jgi:glutamate transport system permease protein